MTTVDVDLTDALCEREAAKAIGCTGPTLAEMRKAGTAPPHLAFEGPTGKLILRYPVDALERWIAARFHRPETSANTKRGAV